MKNNLSDSNLTLHGLNTAHKITAPSPSLKAVIPTDPIVLNKDLAKEEPHYNKNIALNKDIIGTEFY